MFAENPMNPGFHRIFSKHAKIFSMENGDPVITWSLENMQKLWHYFWKFHLRQSESLIITWFHRIFSKHVHVCWKFGESWISLDFKKICKKFFKWRSSNHLVFGKYAKVMALILKIPNGAKRARKVGIYDGQLSGHQESFLGRQFWPRTFRWVPVGTGGHRWPLVESKYYIVTNLDCYKLRLLQT